MMRLIDSNNANERIKRAIIHFSSYALVENKTLNGAKESSTVKSGVDSYVQINPHSAPRT